MVTSKSKNPRFLLAILTTVVFFIAVAGFISATSWSWPITAALMLFMFIAIGWFVNDRYAGVLINERRMMSLSRFQMVLWSLIILSAYAAIAMIRARDGYAANALDIQVPVEIWILLGISSSALVGSPMMASNKMKKAPTIDPNDPSPREERENMGILSVNDNVNKASFVDLFKGEEIKNWNYVDLAKLQMFFFTFIVAIIYCVQLYQLIDQCDMLEEVILPPIDSGMLTLMGISNAAYLGHKGIDQTPSTIKP